MKIGLYPGCSFEGSSREYAESLHAIAPALGLELEEVEGWNCCGASSAHSLDHALSLTLPAKNPCTGGSSEDGRIGGSVCRLF